MEPDSLSLPAPSDLATAIQPWVASARWHFGDTAHVKPYHVAILDSAPNAFAIWFVADDGLRYNIPLVLRIRGSYRAEAAAPSPVGTFQEWDIFDATDDPEGQRLILERSIAPSPHNPLIAHSINTVGSVVAARRLTSEQSNTSIIYDLEDGSRIIIKVFRVFTPGHNPDVELQQALGSTGTVPRQYGSAQLEIEGGVADVVVVQEFLTGTTDAWQVITQDLKDCDGTLGALGPQITDLGRLTRCFHTALAEAFPTVHADAQHITAIRDSWAQRAAAAIAAVPELGEFEGQIEMVYTATAHVNWPDLQRIHGDYHLGQVLNAAGRGWFALDFEGEPLRPLAERTQPDLALRDVAGMLRSFDYAVGSAELDGGDREALASWGEAAREAFLFGYGTLDEESQVLLDALMLDKALYEVSYEVAQRPTWLPIPVAGVRRILHSN